MAKKTHRLPPLFMVMATQNPIEQEGTYPLPEAQMDRFLMHVYISYPDDAAEREVVRLVRGEASEEQQPAAQGKPPTKKEPIPQSVVFATRAEIAQVQIAEPIEDYIVSLVAATRRPAEFSDELARYIQVGVSPRGSIALDKCSRAHAWLSGRDQVTPDDNGIPWRSSHKGAGLSKSRRSTWKSQSRAGAPMQKRPLSRRGLRR